MDLIQLIIEMIVKAFDSPKSRAPSANNPANNPNDVVRQIQARIEAARLQDPRAPLPARPAQVRSGPMRAPIRAAGRAQPPRFAQKKAKRRIPPALPAAVISSPPVKAAVAQAAAPPPPARPAIVNVDAKVLARWLRPQTLRAQFILTEIFQPPVSLRESHLS